MFCGLDFGTSNCSLGIWRNERPELVPISGASPYMPSVVYAERSEYAELPINQSTLNRRIDAALREENAKRGRATKLGKAYRGLSDQQIEQRELGLLRHETVAETESEYSSQTFAEVMNSTRTLLFGEDAIRANVSSPGEGLYFKSPKLFLGADVHKSHLDIFRQVIASMVLEVRDRAETHVGYGLKQAVIGHPVVYSLANRESGNRQALEVMEEAALKAGFSDIEFLPEPFAAAMSYEMTTAVEETILVVDIGGGTTDCAVIQIGPGRAARANRNKDVLSYAGDRVGGVDMDFHIAWNLIMPYFGKGSLRVGGLPIPHSVLYDAISISDFPAQARFRKAGPEIASFLLEAQEPEKLRLLMYLWQRALQFRLVRSAETAKIELSEKVRASLSLGYIDSELEIPVSQDDLMNAIQSDLDRIGAVTREAVRLASAKIDKIFLTGGTSRSPAVIQSIRSSLNREVPVLRGDDFGSVTLGLTRHARNIFGGECLNSK